MPGPLAVHIFLKLVIFMTKQKSSKANLRVHYLMLKVLQKAMYLDYPDLGQVTKFNPKMQAFSKIVGGGKYYDRATQFYAKLRILKLVDMVFFEKALFVFKSKMKMLPDQFSHYLTEVSHVYEKFTRASNQNNYFIPFLNTSKAQRSIKYQGLLIWNALDADLKTCTTLQSFKAKLKNLLLQKYDQET